MGNVPYCIVKGKARLGAVVHKKTATALALTAIKNEDKMEFSKLVEAIKGSYNDRFAEANRKWGGGIMGVKSQAKTAKKMKIINASSRRARSSESDGRFLANATVSSGGVVFDGGRSGVGGGVCEKAAALEVAARAR